MLLHEAGKFELPLKQEGSRFEFDRTNLPKGVYHLIAIVDGKAEIQINAAAKHK